MEITVNELEQLIKRTNIETETILELDLEKDDSPDKVYSFIPIETISYIYLSESEKMKYTEIEITQSDGSKSLIMCGSEEEALRVYKDVRRKVETYYKAKLPPTNTSASQEVLDLILKLARENESLKKQRLFLATELSKAIPISATPEGWVGIAERTQL